MRNLVISSLFVLLALGSADAQSFLSVFGEQQTSWNITGYDLTLEEEYHYTDSFSIIGDTLLNGIVSKLLRRYTNNTYNGQWATVETFLIREDTVLGKLWFNYPLWASPHLIQDMSLMEADSFYLSSVSEWANVDTIYFDNEGRKVIELDYMTGMGLPFTMIEGTGPNVGVAYLYNVPLDRSECPVLLCHHKDEETVYVNDHPAHAGKCRQLVTSLPDTWGAEDVSLAVFPNPANDIIWIKTGNPSEAVVLSIHDMQGGRVFGPEEIGQTTVSLDIRHLARGTYILNAISSSTLSIRTVKLIIP